jgi:hypothetical protein
MSATIRRLLGEYVLPPAITRLIWRIRAALRGADSVGVTLTQPSANAAPSDTTLTQPSANAAPSDTTPTDLYCDEVSFPRVFDGSFAGSPADLSPNAEFHNMYAGKRCFIVGNGPSLQTQDLSPLGSEITFCMNYFWKHPILKEWQPTYYWIVDHLLFLGPEILRHFMVGLRANVHSTTFFVPLLAKRKVQEGGLLPLERTRYVVFRGRLWDAKDVDIDLTTFVPFGNTTVHLCMMTAIYMGCSPIYLIGLDHDELSQPGPPTHFYQTDELSDLPPYKYGWTQLPYKYRMLTMLDRWNGYESLGDIAAKKCLAVYNATAGGFLDVFPRVDYNEVVRR